MPKHKTITVNVTLPFKSKEVIDKLVKKGDYSSISDFIREAIRSHLNTWYSKEWNPEEQK